MPKFSQYLEAALKEAPAVIAIIKTAVPALEDFYNQQKTIVGPYLTTIKTDYAAFKAASDLMKVPKGIAVAEDVIDVWPLAESAFGELKTLLGDDYATVKTSVQNVISGTAAVASAPATTATAPAADPFAPTAQVTP